MPTLKKEILDLSYVAQVAGDSKSFKLDGWKVELHLSIGDGGGEIAFVDGQPFYGGNAGTGNTVFRIPFGGASVKGVPIMLDDYFTLKTFHVDVATFTCVLVKQYFVPSRPGPDKLFDDALPGPQRTERKPGPAPSRNVPRHLPQRREQR